MPKLEPEYCELCHQLTERLKSIPILQKLGPFQVHEWMNEWMNEWMKARYCVRTACHDSQINLKLWLIRFDYCCTGPHSLGIQRIILSVIITSLEGRWTSQYSSRFCLQDGGEEQAHSSPHKHHDHDHDHSHEHATHSHDDHSHSHEHEHDHEAHDHHDHHEHDTEVSSVAIIEKGVMNPNALNKWLGGLLQERGPDIYRSKGILFFHGDDHPWAPTQDCHIRLPSVSSWNFQHAKWTLQIRD